MLGRGWHEDSCAHWHIQTHTDTLTYIWLEMDTLAKSFCLSAHREQTSACRGDEAEWDWRGEGRVGGWDRKQQSMLVTKIAKINWSRPCGFAFASTNCTRRKGIRSLCFFKHFRLKLNCEYFLITTYAAPSSVYSGSTLVLTALRSLRVQFTGGYSNKLYCCSERNAIK